MEEEVASDYGQEAQNADDPALPGASLVAHQEPRTQDQDLPIMHWEDLSLRIAELEKQEEERRKKAEVCQQSFSCQRFCKGSTLRRYHLLLFCQ